MQPHVEKTDLRGCAKPGSDPELPQAGASSATASPQGDITSVQPLLRSPIRSTPAGQANAYGNTWRRVVASLNSARYLGFPRKGALLPGYDADIAVFTKGFASCTLLAWEGTVVAGQGAEG